MPLPAKHDVGVGHVQFCGSVQRRYRRPSLGPDISSKIEVLRGEAPAGARLQFFLANGRMVGYHNGEDWP